MSIAGLFIALALSAFFSGAEAAFVAADRIRCEIALRTGKRGARLACGFVHNPERFIFTTLVGNNAATVVFSALAALLLEPHLSPGTIIVASAAILLLLGEIAPKTLFRERAQQAVRTVAYPLRVFELLLWPVNFLLQRAVLALVGPKAADARATYALFSRKDLAVLLRESFAAGTIAEHEGEMISRLLRLTTRPVRAIMVPRVDMVALPIEAGVEQAQRLFRQSGYSRLPVYQGTLDNIKGVVHVRDLLSRPASLASIVRQVIFVPEMSPCYRLLLEFRRAGVAVAVAVDEYGGTAGMVTLEDVLEELFGEIEDEHDEGQPLWRPLADGDLWVDGTLSVEELGDLLGWRFPRGQHRTVAGLIISHTGRIPHRGEVVEVGRFQFQVVRATRRRVLSLRVRRAEPRAHRS
ncbi:MAG: hemolysin family protein [candidate division KSB1 bacterium]|nr:hemolysin family protein [candidate division KSB1 bacterium]